VRKSIVPITKTCGDVLAIFPRIGSIHDAFCDITFAPVKDISVVGGPFLYARAPIEARVVISSACDIFDFALQSGEAHGASAVHSVVVQFLFEWKFVRLGIDPVVGSKFSVPVSTGTLVVTKKITRPLVRIHNAHSFRQNGNGKDEQY
jgi:hypothetical protein